MSKRYLVKDLIEIKNWKPVSQWFWNIPVYWSWWLMWYTNSYIYDWESILLPRKGTLDNIMYVKWKFRTIDTMYYSIVNKEKVDIKYLYYYLNKLDLSWMYTWTALPSMTFWWYYNVPVTIPDIEEQQKIAKVLSTIDDKIELNNKINSELEAMAKELYEYRFVQFDFPDENGRPYKSSEWKMVWNDELKREIPEGWSVEMIKNVIQHINTWLNPRQNFKLNDWGNIKYITVKNLTTNWDLDFSWCDLITKESKDMINQRSQIRKWDILFASIAPLGRCYLMYETPTEREINESVFSIRSKESISPEYLYMYFMSEEFVKKAEHSSTWSVFSWIRIGTLEGIDILVPTKNIMDGFSQKAKSLYSMKKNIEKQNQRLSELRDFLLPMLMNGQVTVK